MEILEQRMQHIAYRELWDLRNSITAGIASVPTSRG
jgi:hypothetical protein